MPKKIVKKESVSDQIRSRAKDKPEPIKTTANEGDFGTVVSTGSTLLDLAISGGRVRGGGVPRGILMEIFGPSGCVDCDTEFLSITGWKKISEYDNDFVMQYNKQTDIGTFVKPLCYIKQPASELYEFSSLYLNQCLSLNHTVLYRYRKRKNPLLTLPFSAIKKRHETNKHGFEGQFITAFQYDDSQSIIPSLPTITADKLKVSVMSIADGTFDKRRPNSKRCTLNLKKKRKIKRAKELLTEACINFSSGPGSATSYVRIAYNDPYVLTKAFPKVWHQLPKSLLTVIADESVYWDGDCKNRFFSTNKNDADFIQFANICCGKRAAIYVDDRMNKPICYTVTKSNNRFMSMSNSGDSKAKIHTIKPKDGFQYCFEVPSGYLVLRRNNKVFITGNSGKTAVLAEMCADATIKGGNVKFLDPEARLDQEYMRIYGMELEKDNYDMPDTVSEVFDHILKWEPDIPKQGGANIIATDSLAALSSELELSDKGDKMGMKIAKDFSQGLRKTCTLIKKNNFLIACSNQIRQGSSGEVTSGGKGIPFYASLRIRIGPPAKNKYLKTTKTINKVAHEKIYGIQSQCTIKKSSVDDPFRTANVYIVFGLGIDDIRANLAYLKQNTKADSYIAINEEFGRMDVAIKHIEDNNLELELKEQVIDLWEEIEEKFKVKRKPKRRGI
jgi:RecA/RadA recombinase